MITALSSFLQPSDTGLKSRHAPAVETSEQFTGSVEESQRSHKADRDAKAADRVSAHRKALVKDESRPAEPHEQFSIVLMNVSITLPPAAAEANGQAAMSGNDVGTLSAAQALPGGEAATSASHNAVATAQPTLQTVADSPSPERQAHKHTAAHPITESTRAVSTFTEHTTLAQSTTTIATTRNAFSANAAAGQIVNANVAAESLTSGIMANAESVTGPSSAELSSAEVLGQRQWILQMNTNLSPGANRQFAQAILPVVNDDSDVDRLIAQLKSGLISNEIVQAPEFATRTAAADQNTAESAGSMVADWTDLPSGNQRGELASQQSPASHLSLPRREIADPLAAVSDRRRLDASSSDMTNFDAPGIRTAGSATAVSALSSSVVPPEVQPESAGAAIPGQDESTGSAEFTSTDQQLTTSQSETTRRSGLLNSRQISTMEGRTNRLSDGTTLRDSGHPGSAIEPAFKPTQSTANDIGNLLTGEQNRNPMLTQRMAARTGDEFDHAKTSQQSPFPQVEASPIALSSSISSPGLTELISSEMRLPLSSQVSQAIYAHVQQQGSANRSTLTMRLDPPDLGELVIRFSRTEHGMSIRVTAREPVTMDMLLARGHEIEQHLKGNNLDLSNVEFSAFDSDSGHEQRSSQKGQPDDPGNPLRGLPGAGRRAVSVAEQADRGSQQLNGSGDRHQLNFRA